MARSQKEGNQIEKRRKRAKERGREERGSKEDEERGLGKLRERHTVPHFIYQVLEYEECQTQRKWQSP